MINHFLVYSMVRGEDAATACAETPGFAGELFEELATLDHGALADAILAHTLEPEEVADWLERLAAEVHSGRPHQDAATSPTAPKGGSDA